MEPAKLKEFPWKIWIAFSAWAQDFSLMQKVLGGFLGVVILVGILTSMVGTRLAGQTIVDGARSELNTDLATARLILGNYEDNLEIKIRMMAASENIKGFLERSDIEGLRNRLAMLSIENDLDFLSVTDNQGNILVRAFVPHPETVNVSADPLVAKALSGKNAARVRVISVEEMTAENPGLAQRLGQKAKTGMIIEAAHPVMIGTRVAGALYSGKLLNNNLIVDQIAQHVFVGKVAEEDQVGQVTIYQGSQAISTTFRGQDGLPMVGFEGGTQIRQKFWMRESPASAGKPCSVTAISRRPRQYLMWTAKLQELFKLPFLDSLLAL